MTEKAYYNYTDLNRIESWCKYLSEILTSYSYQINIETKTNWVATDFPTLAEMERIRKNIVTLKDAFYSFTEVPNTTNNMTYQKANDLERILREIDYLLMSMENNFVYCGVANSGQNRIWQQRFRRKYSYIVPISWLEFPYTYWNELSENATWEEVSCGNRNIEL